MKLDFQSAKGAERRRMLARIISHLANASVEEALAFSNPPEGGANWRIGITGPPGSGKSSIIARLAAVRVKAYPKSLDFGHESLAVLAIDPSSTVRGGAVLGDRVRMDSLVDDPRIYVRSIASRGGPEGLAHNITDLLAAADLYGFDEILLETVGIGQAECAVRILVDCLVLVLHPDAGDSIQAMKSGISELADIYVINKADLPGAQRTAAELRSVLKANPSRGTWTVPVIEVSKDSQGGLEALNEAINNHRAALEGTRDDVAVRACRRRYHLRSLLVRCVDETLAAYPTLLELSEIRERYNAALTRMSGVSETTYDNNAY